MSQDLEEPIDEYQSRLELFERNAVVLMGADSELKGIGEYLDD